MKGEGFEIDWQSKCDFTASTYAYFSMCSNFSAVTFYEQDKDGHNIPFGDDRAYSQSHTDITFTYYSNCGWEKEVINELKERGGTYTSTNKYLMEEGEIFEPFKKETLQKLKDEGKEVRWAVLYTDGKIRIWNLNKIDLDSLKRRITRKRKHTIDPNSGYIVENEYLLPADKSIIIDRIRGVI